MPVDRGGAVADVLGMRTTITLSLSLRRIGWPSNSELQLLCSILGSYRGSYEVRLGLSSDVYSV